MENHQFSELPSEFQKIVEAEKVRDCILVSLRDELIKRQEQLGYIDILDVVRDSIDVPEKYIKTERKGETSSESPLSEVVKTSRILEQMTIHNFTKKSLKKCGMYIPFPR